MSTKGEIKTQGTKKSEWYADGLRFECTQCGNCCTGPPGYVWFNNTETEAMARELGMSPVEFREKYAHRHAGKWTLNEVRNDKGHYDCVFLERDENGKGLCSIYKSRPTQCRTWPFWPENLRSERAWLIAARGCPGMTDGLEGGGKFYAIEDIRVIRDTDYGDPEEEY